jgi:hypothetical protein
MYVHIISSAGILYVAFPKVGGGAEVGMPSLPGPGGRFDESHLLMSGEMRCRMLQ